MSVKSGKGLLQLLNDGDNHYKHHKITLEEIDGLMKKFREQDYVFGFLHYGKDNSWRNNPLAVRQWDEVHAHSTDKLYIAVLPFPDNGIRLRPINSEDGDDIEVTYDEWHSNNMYIITNLNIQTD